MLVEFGCSVWLFGAAQLDTTSSPVHSRSASEKPLQLLQQPLSTSTRLYLPAQRNVLKDVEEGMSALKTRSDTGDDKQSELRGQAKTADDAGHNARPGRC